MIKIINSPLPRPNLEFSKTLEIPFTPLATFLGVVMPAFLILTLVYYTQPLREVVYSDRKHLSHSDWDIREAATPPRVAVGN